MHLYKKQHTWACRSSNLAFASSYDRTFEGRISLTNSWSSWCSIRCWFPETWVQQHIKVKLEWGTCTFCCRSSSIFSSKAFCFWWNPLASIFEGTSSVIRIFWALLRSFSHVCDQWCVANCTPLCQPFSTGTKNCLQIDATVCSPNLDLHYLDMSLTSNHLPTLHHR